MGALRDRKVEEGSKERSAIHQAHNLETRVQFAIPLRLLFLGDTAGFVSPLARFDFAERLCTRMGEWQSTRLLTVRAKAHLQVRILLLVPRRFRLVWPRTLPSHGGNTRFKSGKRH
jgi:hypothetical protein